MLSPPVIWLFVALVRFKHFIRQRKSYYTIYYFLSIPNAQKSRSAGVIAKVRLLGNEHQ